MNWSKKPQRGQTGKFQSLPHIIMHCNKNHSTQDSRVVPHRGTNWAVLWLTLQIGRDAVLSESYGRGYTLASK